MLRALFPLLFAVLTGCGGLDPEIGDRIHTLEEENGLLKEQVILLEERMGTLEKQLKDAMGEAAKPRPVIVDAGLTADDEALAEADPVLEPAEEDAPEAAVTAEPEPEPEPSPPVDDADRPKGILQVDAPADGRAIYVDGEKTGHVTPAAFEWPIGAVTVMVFGYAPTSAQVNEGTTTVVTAK